MENGEVTCPACLQELCEVVGFKVAGRTVSPYSKLMGVLWWLAGRESMKQIVKRFDWSIGTFHGAVHLFSTAIVEHLMPQTIRWPSLEDEVKRCLVTFEQNYNFQGKTVRHMYCGCCLKN